MNIKKEPSLHNLINWKDTIKEIFPESIPDKHEWTYLRDILLILNIISKEFLNHMMLPYGGGIDLQGAIPSEEMNCINLLSSDGYEVVKPKKLTFYSISKDCEWAYFRLETDNIQDSSFNDNEVASGAYVIVAKGSVYNNVPLTYHGFHNEFKEDEFYEFMVRSYKHSKRKEILKALS